MSFIISPSYSFNAIGIGYVKSAELLPMYEAPLVAEPEGTLLEFNTAGDVKEIPVPVPNRVGLDDIELDRVGFELSTAKKTEDVSVNGSPSGGAVTLTLTGPSAAAAKLERVEIENLRINATSAANFVLSAINAGLSNVVYSLSGSETEVTPNGSAGSAKQVHILVRPASNGGFGPPMAAAPHFAMPGAGGGLYGPALGSALLTLTEESSKRIKATLRLEPPLTGGRFSLLIGHADKTGVNEGLPNEIQSVTWSASNVKAVYDVRPTAISVKATTQANPSEQPIVSEFPSDPGTTPLQVDFSGVARSLLKQAYPSATGQDLGLKLLFTCGTPGTLRVNLGSAAARYLKRPLTHGPASLRLLGAPESLDLVVSDQFKPAAVSFTIDGVYGPSRLTLDSDTSVPDARHGLRVAAGIRIARRVALTAAEAHLPIARLGVYGRASEPSELLLTLHKGDELRIGPPITEPLSIEIDSSPDSAWHRKEFPAPGLLPPQPGILWMVARVSRGAFWWHGGIDAEGSTQRSPDDGATFSQARGRPAAHVSVLEVDPDTGNPSPVQPVSLSWRDGLLNADVVSVAMNEASLPPDFRRFWIAEGTGHAAFLQSIPSLAGLLRLTFHCQRDLDLTISDAVLTYDPWNS